MLEVKNLDVFHDKIQALWDVSLKIDDGEIVALIGANGAGKTTLLNAICGLLRPAAGSISLNGRGIDGLPCHVIAGMGISHVPEGGRLFADMSVRENLEMGAYPGGAWKERHRTLEEVYRLFPRLKEREKQLATTLSGGEQQMLAMGRGLMSHPRLCILDEPSYGLAPRLMLEVFKIIESLNEQGITILLIEQNVRHSLEIADRAYVLENGRIVLEGSCGECLASEHVKKAYLGL